MSMCYSVLYTISSTSVHYKEKAKLISCILCVGPTTRKHHIHVNAQHFRVGSFSKYVYSTTN